MDRASDASRLGLLERLLLSKSWSLWCRRASHFKALRGPHSGLARRAVSLLGKLRERKLLRDFFRASEFVPNVVLDTSSFEVIKRYVAEGIGISFLPKETITGRDSRLAVVRVSGMPRVAIGAIWRAGSYQTRATTLFLEQFAGFSTAKRRR